MIVARKVLRQPRKLRLVRLDYAANAKQPENIWWTLERAEHQNDPAVLSQVCDRLHSASVEVNVGNGRRPQNTKRIEPFRRKIHVTSRIQRR